MHQVVDVPSAQQLVSWAQVPSSSLDLRWGQRNLDHKGMEKATTFGKARVLSLASVGVGLKRSNPNMFHLSNTPSFYPLPLLWCPSQKDAAPVGDRGK